MVQKRVILGPEAGHSWSRSGSFLVQKLVQEQVYQEQVYQEQVYQEQQEQVYQEQQEQVVYPGQGGGGVPWCGVQEYRARVVYTSYPALGTPLTDRPRTESCYTPGMPAGQERQPGLKTSSRAWVTSSRG